jgi:hypothetical protein
MTRSSLTRMTLTRMRVRSCTQIYSDQRSCSGLVLKIKLANSTESELKTLQSSLRNAKDDTASDLQRNVFKKYAF